MIRLARGSRVSSTPLRRRISERFAWPLDLRVQGGNRYVAEIRFPQPLPVPI